MYVYSPPLCVSRRGSLFKYDNTVAFWNFLASGNYASRFYRFAIRDINALQSKLMEESLQLIRRVEAEVMAGTSGSAAVKLLTAATDKAAFDIVSSWRDLLPHLITKYHDGYEASELTAPHILMKKLFYPVWWLKATGYFDSLPNSGPDVIMFAENAQAEASRQAFMAAAVSSVLSVAATLAVVYYFQRKNTRIVYSPIGGEDNL